MIQKTPSDDAFHDVRRWFAGMPASLANSAGSYYRLSFQMTRPGIALYGAHPADLTTDRLTRVVTWQAAFFNCGKPKLGIALAMVVLSS